MEWRSVAEDVALKIIQFNPIGQDPGGVHFCGVALLGMCELPDCPEAYQAQAQALCEEYARLATNVGEFAEWNEIAIGTHRLLARLGGCEVYATRYYDQ